MKIDVVIPVYNESHVLDRKIRELSAFLNQHCFEEWQIVIVDNASTDNTFEEMQKVSSSLPRIQGLHLDKKGRGRALKFAWSSSKSDVVCYMDVDLSTDLSAFVEMVEAFKNGADIVVGSRLKKGAKIRRCFLREFLSRGYNIFHRLLLQTDFTDAQCGFKGFTRKAIQVLLPLSENREWFLDTELLLLGERLGFKISEIPVIWAEDSDTRVNILKAVIEDIRGLLRMRWMFWFDKRFKEKHPGKRKRV